MGKILVTGANGMVGHAVCEKLQAAKRPFTAIDLRSAQKDGYPVLALDIRDVHALYALTEREGPFEAIIHCGALSGPMLARDNPVLLYDVNVTGTVNLLEMARIKRLRRIALCSSVSAYGNTPEGLSPVRENAPLRPSTVYGASKAACEAIAHGYAVQHKVDSVCLRIGWVYGPYRTTDCDIREMILAGLRGEIFKRSTGLQTMRQYVHVHDIARALILACDTPPTRLHAYNVNGDRFLPLPQVAEIVKSVIPDLNVEFGVGRDPDEDVQARFDLEAALADLGYSPSVSLEQGIAEYAAWLQAQLNG